MDFLPLIIGVVVAIIIGATKSKKTQPGGASTPVPKGHGENFPFPKEFRELFNLEDEEVDDAPKSQPQHQSQPQSKPRPTYQTVESQGRGVEEFQSFGEGVAMTRKSQMPKSKISAAHSAMNVPISQRKAGIAVDAPLQVEQSIAQSRLTSDFDLRKAIIYSEIINPKYL